MVSVDQEMTTHLVTHVKMFQVFVNETEQEFSVQDVERFLKKKELV